MAVTVTTSEEQIYWEKEIWPLWLDLITFKRIKRLGPAFIFKWNRRTKTEVIDLIDQMLEDLGEAPE